MRRWDTPFAAGAVGLCVLLRLLQLRSTAHRLYDPEWVDFITFTEHLRAGTVELSSLEQFLHAYQHQGASQGVAAVQILAAAFSALLGPTVWSLHAVTMICELVLVAVVALLLRRVGSRILAAFGIALFVFVPSFVVTWQLLPFGNHSEFFFLPALMALFLVGRPLAERSVWHWLLPMAAVAVGFFLYRVLLAPSLAFAAATLLVGEGRARVFGPLAVVAGLGLALSALAFAFGGSSFTPLLGNLSLLAPRMEPSLPYLLEQLSGAWLYKLPRAPRTSTLGLIYPILLLSVIPVLFSLLLSGRLDRERRALHLFALLWALVGLLMPSLSAALRGEYLLTGVYALLLCWALVVMELPLRGRLGLLRAPALTLVLLGAADGGRYVQPASWEVSADYEGVRFWRDLGLHWVDPDDVPYFTRIVREGRAHRAMSFGWLFVDCPFDTSDAAGRVPGGRIADLQKGHCEGWKERELALHVQEYRQLEPELQTGLDTGYMQRGTSFDADAVGRGAWILCNRDLSRVARALVGLEAVEAEAILAGARAEAALWAEPSGLP